jgi:excinuclease ABC subunit B
VLEIGPAYEDRLIRMEFFGDEVDAIRYVDPLTGSDPAEPGKNQRLSRPSTLLPRKTGIEEACNAIQEELQEQLEHLEKEGKLLEAQRLEQRTRYDLEMMREVGYCNGVENYARHLAGRQAGSPPECLIDYFPEDWLLVIDESHVTIPQIGGHVQRRSQPQAGALIEHGFRLPSAADNRPLKAEEFWDKVDQCIFVSATPGLGV